MKTIKIFPQQGGGIAPRTPNCILVVDYWQDDAPTATAESQYWFSPADAELYKSRANDGGFAWDLDVISKKTLYVYLPAHTSYMWNGGEMVVVGTDSAPTIDKTLSPTSRNPLENRAIYALIATINSTLGEHGDAIRELQNEDYPLEMVFVDYWKDTVPLATAADLLWYETSARKLWKSYADDIGGQTVYSWEEETPRSDRLYISIPQRLAYYWGKDLDGSTVVMRMIPLGVNLTVTAGDNVVNINDYVLNMAHRHSWEDIVNKPNYVSHITVGNGKAVFHYANGDVFIADFQPIVSRVADLEHWRGGSEGAEQAISDLQSEVESLKEEKQDVFIRFSEIVEGVTVEQMSTIAQEGHSYDLVLAKDLNMLLLKDGTPVTQNGSVLQDQQGNTVYTYKYYHGWNNIPGILDREKIDIYGDFLYMTDGQALTIYHWHGDAATGGYLPTGAKVTVDSVLSSVSVNPVENRVIKAALDSKASDSDVTALQTAVNGIIADYATKAGLSEETAARQVAIAALSKSVTDETEARQTVDTHLQKQIDQLFNDIVVEAGVGYIDIGDNHIVVLHNHSFEDIVNAPDFLVGVTVGEGRMSFLHRNGDQTSVEGLFNRVAVTIDGTSGGTPSVDASCSDGLLTLNFHNIKGEIGPKGDTIIIGSGETYTLYNAPGQATDGAMTQKAVTDLAATKVAKDNTETTQIADTSADIQICDGNGNVVAMVDASGVSAAAFVFRDRNGEITGTFRVEDLLVSQRIADNVKIRESNAVHVADANGNVVATAGEDGVSAASFNVKDSGGNVVGKYDSDMATAMGGVRECVRMRDKGMFVTDGDGNIAAQIDARGAFDVKAIGSNLRGIIADMSGGGSMPEYIKTEYSETLEKVQALQGSDTFSFAFITDLHFCNEDATYDAATKATLRDGVQHSMAALAKLSKEYPLATVVANGDYTQLPSTHTKQMGIDCIMDINRWMADVHCPNFALCGNHEYSYSGNPLDSSNFGLSRSEIYNYLSRRYVTGEVRKAAERVYYQIDDADGVVFVFITTTGACATLGVSISTSGIEDDLKAGYDTVMAANAGGYPYILFSHYSNNLPSGSTAARVNPNIGYTIDYFNAAGTVLFYVGGHVHSDWALVHSSGGKSTLVVSCLQAGAWTNEQSQDGVTYSHVAGTATESAFSVFTVNRLAGQVHCTRFGLGRDRTINYNATSGTVGAVTYSD